LDKTRLVGAGILHHTSERNKELTPVQPGGTTTFPTVTGRQFIAVFSAGGSDVSFLFMYKKRYII
jgi:hypothetical protein